MNIKIEYSFEDWRDWFLIERKGFMIKVPFIPLRLLFERDEKPVHEMKFKIPLNVKKMHVIYSSDYLTKYNPLPDMFFVEPLAEVEFKLNLGLSSRHPLTFKKVETTDRIYCSNHDVCVSNGVVDAFGKNKCIRKFRFCKGLVGYVAK